MGEYKIKLYEGDMVGKLTFVKESGRIRNLRACTFKCHCGKHFETAFSWARSGNTQSCGCDNHGNLLHGETGTVEYETWNSIKRRCKGYNAKSRKNYTDKGITVCDRWIEPDGQGFKNFLEDTGRRPEGRYSLDRIDGNKGYSPENCRWTDYTQQANNREGNVHLTYKGEIKTIGEWADTIGMKYVTFYGRYMKLWSIEDMIEKPLRHRYNNK